MKMISALALSMCMSAFGTAALAEGSVPNGSATETVSPNGPMPTGATPSESMENNPGNGVCKDGTMSQGGMCQDGKSYKDEMSNGGSSNANGVTK